KNSSKSNEPLIWQWVEDIDPSKITDVEVRTAYRLNLPKCKSCRKNCQGKPTCLFGLGEAQWMSAPSDLDRDNLQQKLEKQIEAEKRKEGELVGLKNLGATCYVNTYLQLWYHNVSFRNALYSLEYKDEDLALQQSLCGQLQLIFGLLESGVSKSVDPTEFIKCLGLATDLQQDAQEFSKLFLSLLETTPSLSQVIKDQFCGEYTYVTICQSCKSATQRPSNFYELDLNIQGNKDLKSCLTEFLREEKLVGENQYYCTKCKSKQNAIRKICLKKLPQTLNLQLLRFVYDRASQSRQKISTNLSFPDYLDFPMVESGGHLLGHDDTQYKLTAVLIHRGLSASSGHFVAHIWEPESGNWYKFNDELDLDSYKGEDNVCKEIIQELEPAPKKIKLSKGCHSSKDVYMLVYSKATVDMLKRNPVPEAVKKLVDEHNATDEKRVKDMEMRKKMVSFIQILHSEKESKHQWLPAKILKHFLNTTKSDSVLKQEINYLCSHGNLKVDKAVLLKYVPKPAADIVQHAYPGLKPMSDLMLCHTCVKNQCLLIQSKKKLKEDHFLVSECLKTQQNGLDKDPGEFFYVGKQSLKRWRSLAMQDIMKKYGSTSSLDVADSTDSKSNTAKNESSDECEDSFNSDLLCDHNALTIDQSCFQFVPLLIWNVLKYYFPDCVQFKFGQATPCQTCLNDVISAQKKIVERKKFAIEQKSNLHQLFLGKNRPSISFLNEVEFLTESNQTDFFVVSNQFLSEWREFVRHPEKHEPVTSVSNDIFMCAHGKLLYDPLLILASDKDVEEDDFDHRCELVWSAEWRYIVSNFIVDHEICINKTLPIESTSRLIYTPELCITCMAGLEAKKFQQLCRYEDAEIYVLKSTQSAQDFDSFQNKNGEILSKETRRGKRVRRCVRGEKKLTNLSSTLTLKDLKIRIMNQFSVPPFDQNLWMNGKRLMNDELTLETLHIIPGCTITVVEDTPSMDNSALIFEPVKTTEPETGFQGTGLLGY
uniref:ubiquitinyl hydrolase 1 n=1 Tax=Ciona savignyi TaxID=51511 RepID=H2YRV2_CIOSA